MESNQSETAMEYCIRVYGSKNMQYWAFKKLLSLKYGIKVCEVTQDIVDKYNQEMGRDYE